MQDADRAELPADEAGIGPTPRGGCGSSKQQVVDQARVLLGDAAQCGGRREGEQEVGCGQQQVLLFPQPALGSGVLALGTVTVAARVVAVTRFVTSRTVIDMAAQGLLRQATMARRAWRWLADSRSA